VRAFRKLVVGMLATCCVVPAAYADSTMQVIREPAPSCDSKEVEDLVLKDIRLVRDDMLVAAAINSVGESVNRAQESLYRAQQELSVAPSRIDYYKHSLAVEDADLAV
jgi:hypothetical protein